MNKKNKLFKLTVLSSLFAFSLTSCNAASSTSVIITQNIDLTGVEFENVSETVTYDGLPHSIFAKNVPEGVTVTYENNGAIEIGTHKIIAHFSKKTSGYSSNVRYLETTQIATLNIVKDATNVSETLSEKLNKLTMDEMVVTYNGSPYTVLLNDPTLIPAGFKAMYSNNVHTAAGTYSVSCKIVNAETMISYRTLYSKMVINKAEIDIKDVKFENITYPSDGQVHTIEATNLPSNVSVRYELVNSNITDSLPANAITNVGYKEVKAIFTIDAASQLARSNYIIVNSNETDKTKNSMTARIEILAAGSVVYNIKYRVVQYEETFDSATNKVTNRTRKYVLDSNGQPAIYSQATLNTSYGNYISTSNLIAREGYSFEIADNTYSDILTERGYLVPDGATGGDIIIDYVPEIYTVNFSGENISLNSRDYTSVEERDLINPKVADGYRFMGWYSDSGFNFPITSLRGLTGNRTIYGRAINDSKLPSNFSIKDTFTTWDGTNKRVEVLGVPPSDVKLRYYYYKIESDGSKTLINELDENKTPTDVGRYSVVVSFYAIKDGNATDEKRYEDLTVYLVIEPANASSSSVFASTSFEWYAEFKERRFEKANYPVLTNYPQNATNITYEYFDTNRNSLGVGDDNRPIDPGQYLVKASYKLADGTDEGKVFEIWTSFEITKKSYPIDFLNGIRKVFTDFTYEIDSGKGTVTITRSDGKVILDNLQNFANRGFTSGLTVKSDLHLDGEGESVIKYFMLSDIFGVYHSLSYFNKDDGSYMFGFSNGDGFQSDYGNLIVKFTNDKINFNEVGQLSTMMYFEFEDEEYAKYNNLPNIMYSSLTVYTSGESRVQFVTSDGIEIKSESVTTGSSVPAPTLNDYSKYLPNDSNLYNEYEYEVKWVSDNMFSSLSHIVCDTKFVLTIIEREFSLKFVVEDVSKGTVNPLPNQTFTKSTSTTFNELSPTFEKGYYLAGYYTLNANGQKNSFDRNSTFAQVARSYNQNTNNLPYCTDLVVYILSAASQTSSTFDPNGGALNSGATFYQTFGQPFNLPADPIAPANSTFLGWALNGVIVTKTTIYDDYSGETLKFVAQYSSSTSTVTFLPENGDAYMTFGISNNEVIPIPSVIPTKVGYTFRGWYLNNVKLEEGTIFRGGSSLVYIAQYDVIKIDVIYHNNVIHSQVDEADDILIIKSADYGSIIPNPTTEEGSTLLPPTLSGYVFSGWSLDGTRLINSSNRITNVSQKLVDGVLSYYIDIYPVYQNNNYKITYAFNVENVLNTARDVIFNEVVSAEQAPARMGYYFDGWYTTSTFDVGTNFFDEILKNPADGINADSYPYERDIVLYAKWVRKEYKVTFRYVPDITKPNVYVDYPLNGMTIAYGQLLTSTGNIRTWLTEDEIYSTTVGAGLGLTRDVTPIFTYRNGSLISEGQAFLYDPASYELGDDINRVYDKLNPNNNTAIIYINSTINNYFNVSYVADENCLPTIQSVRGNADFTLKNHPIREGKRWVAYYYYYVENNQTKKYYLTSDGTINGTPLNTWNLSNAAAAKNGITNYVLYSEFEALKYRLFIRTNDQESLIGTRDFGGITKENYIETEYGQPYNILSNAFSTDFKAEINRILATKGYRFDYWRDNFGRIITANTVLTDPKAIDIESSYVYTQDNQIDYANSNYEAGIYLYAQVLPLTYKLTFFPDNNTNPYVINVGYNQSYTKMGDPVKDGYRFIGWKYFDAATFDIDKYRDGTLDPNCELKTGEFSDVRYNQTRDIIAVAQYDGDQYTITYKYSTFTSTDDSYSFNGDNYTNSTVVENIKFSQSYTLKDLNDNDFTNLNADYKKYLLLYDFYGWQDEANQTIYPAGTTFSEYNRSTSSTYRAIYTPKDFTVEFLYQTIDNSSMSALTGTKKVTRIASREKVILNNSLNTPADPVPDSDLYGTSKLWIPSAKKGLTSEGTFSPSDNYEMNLDFVFKNFYNSNYSLFNQDINNAILRDDDANNFRTLSFNLTSNSSAGYYRIYLNNYNTNVTSLDGSTYYDVYGQNESGSEELLEAGSRIKLPNINLTISNGENFTCKDPRDDQVTTKSLQVLGGNNSNGDPYTYTINGNTFKPFLRTVYVFNGEYYLDGDLSPVGITGTRDNPTELYAFTTYVSGTYYENNGTKYYSELFNFTLKDEDGEYLKSYIPSKKGAVEDDYTLENKNEIAFAGFMNKAYTSIGNSYDNLTYRPVLIPYFYYDSQSGIIRKVTAIAHDQSGLGAFEESNYATQYFLPGTISYIASNSFKNAFTSNESGEEVYVSYLDSSAFFDYSAVILDSSLTGGSKLRAISASNFRYVGVDNTASYDSHRFFAGRLYTNRSYQTINTYTVLGFLNSFTSPTEYASSEGPNGKQGDYFYYSSSNPSRIPAFFKNLSAAVSDATTAGISKEIIAFSQTSSKDGVGQVPFNLAQREDAYPFFLYYGTAVDFIKSYGTLNDINALKITDEGDLPVGDEGLKYPDSPYYHIQNFYLTLPFKEAKKNTVKNIDIVSLTELNAIYLDTPSMIVNKLYKGTPEEKAYFDAKDPINSSDDDNFVTTYSNYQTGSNSAKLAYFYNGDSEEEGLNGTEYLIQQLIGQDQEKANKIRDNFNSKCFEYEYDSDGNVVDGTLTKMIATKNYKTQSVEYFYIGNYESFLGNGKDYVDQYKGQIITFLDLTNDQLVDFDPENPLGIIDQDTKLKKIYIGTSSSYLASLSSEQIKDRIDENFLINCINSETDYNITPLFFGTLDKYRNLDRTDASINSNYPLQEGFLIQCLQSEDTTNISLVRDTIFAYFNDHDSSDTTKFIDYTTTLYQFSEDGDFITTNNAPFYYNLTLVDDPKLIFQVKLDPTDTTRNIYYTSTASTFASSYFDTFKLSTIAVLNYDYNKDQRYDGTVRTSLTSNDLERLFVGTIDDIGTTDGKVSWSNIRNSNNLIPSKHVAYYLTAQTSSTIVYDVASNTFFDNRMNGNNTSTYRTYLTYFFNSYDTDDNRYKNLVTVAGSNYYYNENIKTILAGVNTLNLKTDLYNLLTSNSLIYNALYCFKDNNDDGNKNTIASSNFLPMYYGTDQNLLESIKAGRVTINSRFIFVKPDNNYTADIADVSVDDMGLAFGVDSKDGTILKAYVSSLGAPSLDNKDSYINNKNRFISIITLTDDKTDDKEASYDIYYYFRGLSTSAEARKLLFSLTEDETDLKYHNKFVLYEGSNKDASDDFYNFVGTIDDIISKKSDPLLRYNSFYNLFDKIEIDETNPQIKDAHGSIFFMGNAASLEANSTALGYSDVGGFINTQIVDENFRIGVGGLNDVNKSNYDNIQFYADLITVLLLDSPKAYSVIDEIKNSSTFMPVSYYRGEFFNYQYQDNNDIFDYLFLGKQIGGDKSDDYRGGKTLSNDVYTNKYNFVIKNDDGGTRNSFFLFRGNNSLNKGIFAFDDNKYNKPDIRNGQLFGTDQLDLSATDDEKNLAIPVYYDFSEHPSVSNPSLLKTYEGYDIITVIEDNVEEDPAKVDKYYDEIERIYSSITYIGSPSKFIEQRKVNNTPLYAYQDSSTFFENDAFIPTNFYIYNKSAFNYAEIVYQTDTEGNSTFSESDSGSLRTMLLVDNSVILNTHNGKKRNNNTSMAFYASLFTNRFNNAVPLLLNYNTTVFSARISYINPVITVIGNNDVDGNGKITNQDITNKLYIGTSQPVDTTKILINQYKESQFKLRNDIDSILFDDNLTSEDSHLYDDEEVIGITSKDEGLLDRAGPNTSTEEGKYESDQSIGSTRPVLVYYINKYIDQGVDPTESPVVDADKIASVSDYKKIIKANYIGDGFIKQKTDATGAPVEDASGNPIYDYTSIAQYYSDLDIKDAAGNITTYGVMDLIPVVQFKKQVQVEVGRNPSPTEDDPDHEDIEYENQNVTVIAELLSMSNLTNNKTSISYLSAGWFGYGTEYGLQMDGNNIANSWLSQASLGSKIQDNRVYIPRWVKHYTEQSFDDGSVVPKLQSLLDSQGAPTNRTYDGRTYMKIDNPNTLPVQYAATSVDNEFIADFSTDSTFDSYLKLDLVDAEENYGDTTTINQGYYPQTLVTSTPAIRRLNTAFDLALEKEYSHGPVARYIQDASDLLANTDYDSLSNSSKDESLKNHQTVIFKLGDTWYLRHVAQKDMRIFFDGSIGGLTPTDISTGTVYYFKFEPITWKNLNPNNEASPYFVPNKILDVTTTMTDYLNYDFTKNTFKKYTFSENKKIADKYLGGSNSSTDSIYDTYRNNSYTPSDVNIYTDFDDNSNPFSNDFSDAQNNSFYFNDALRASGKTSLLEYMLDGNDTETTDDYKLSTVISNFAMYKFYCYFGAGNSYTYQDFYKAATTDSEALLSSYSFYNARIIFNTLIDGSTLGVEYINIDYYDVPLSYYSNKIYIFNQYSRAFALGDIGFFYPIVRLEYTTNSNN